MTLHQWLRYALPGSLFEALVGGWLLVDEWECACYPNAPSIDTAAIALLAAASLPLGFVASVLMNQLLWWGSNGIFIDRFDSRRLMAQFGFDEAKNMSWEAADSRLDAWMHVATDRAKLSSARERARSLLDIMNALAVSWVATMLALVVIIAALTIKLEYTSDHLSSDRLLVLLLYCGGLLAFGGVLLTAEQRVARMAEIFIQDLLIAAKFAPEQREAD